MPILMTILAIIIIFFLFILLGPFKINFNFNLREYKIVSSGSIAFINPKIFLINFDYTKRKVDIFFWGKTLKREVRKDKEEKRDRKKLEKKEKSLSESIVKENKKEDKTFYYFDKREESVSDLSKEQISRKEIKKESIQKKDNLNEREDNKLKIIFFLFRNKKWRQKLFSWVKRVVCSFFKIIKFDRFYLSIWAGVEDPAISGYIFGVYQLLYSTLLCGYKNKKQINFSNVFMKNHFEFESTFSFYTSLLRITLPFLLAFFTFPLLDTFLLWRKAKIDL